MYASNLDLGFRALSNLGLTTSIEKLATLNGLTFLGKLVVDESVANLNHAITTTHDAISSRSE